VYTPQLKLPNGVFNLSEFAIDEMTDISRSDKTLSQTHSVRESDASLALINCTVGVSVNDDVALAIILGLGDELVLVAVSSLGHDGFLLKW
jgi:hypothetical protein